MAKKISAVEREKAYRAAWYEMPGVGGKTLENLIQKFGSAKHAWQAGTNRWAAVVGKKAAAAIAMVKNHYDVNGSYQELADKGYRLLALGLDGVYPKLLADQVKPPLLVYVRGEMAPEDERAVAIVGSRRPSAYGREVTRGLAYDLAQSGYCIVSGLAYGVDSIAHRGALDAGGRTIAVLGSPISQITPHAHKSLADEIVRHGAVISTFALTKAVKAGQFVARDATIAGLALGVLVTEGDDKSGSLYTAQFGHRLGRPVMAVPGPVTSRLSDAPTKLLKQGARLVTGADDVRAVLGDSGTKTAGPSRLLAHKIAALTDLEQKQIVGVLNEQGELSADEMSRHLHMRPAELGTVLTLLEIEGIIARRGEVWVLGGGT